MKKYVETMSGKLRINLELPTGNILDIIFKLIENYD